MRTRTLVAAVGISSVLTLAVGCASPIAGSATAQRTSASVMAVSSSSAPAATVTVVPPSTVTHTVTAGPEPTGPPAPSTVTVPDPGTMSDAKIRTEVAAAVTVVDQYWQNLFSTWHGPDGGPVFWWTPQLYHGDGFYDSALGAAEPICNGESVGPDNAGFCPDGYGVSGFGSLSWDMELFRPFAAQGNDAVYYLVVAHETAHAAQTRFDFDNQDPAVLDDTTVALETQADCIAGATLAKAAQDGYLTIDAGDQEEIQAVMIKFGDFESDHGTPLQRYSAFEQGYQTADIESCLGQR